MFQQRKALKPSYLPMFLSSLYRLRVQIMHGFKILIQPLRGVQLEQTIWKMVKKRKAYKNQIFFSTFFSLLHRLNENFNFTTTSKQKKSNFDTKSENSNSITIFTLEIKSSFPGLFQNKTSIDQRSKNEREVECTVMHLSIFRPVFSFFSTDLMIVQTKIQKNTSID